MILNIIIDIIKTLAIMCYFVLSAIALIIGMDFIHTAQDNGLFYFGVKLVLSAAVCLGIGLIFFI